ncbi:hypothetical protein SCAPIOD190016 [Staphylococcus capitis]|nr:hypothetical protein CR01_10146 [Staphylococcus capitis CR01]CQD27093.1 hypothetical protein SCAPIOD150027 [Staphylococcus capitis]CQD27582.1 hypothetical protein SCAPIOD190016 [Staphylococcus capitis]CQD33178.1 hypothetical protein SCAPIOD50015 [Staphylococcus capitis]CUT96327.1 hypothetical protein BN1317_40145 [Staphylococcus capitis]
MLLINDEVIKSSALLLIFGKEVKIEVIVKKYGSGVCVFKNTT